MTFAPPGRRDQFAITAGITAGIDAGIDALSRPKTTHHPPTGFACSGTAAVPSMDQPLPMSPPDYLTTTVVVAPPCEVVSDLSMLAEIDHSSTTCDACSDISSLSSGGDHIDDQDGGDGRTRQESAKNRQASEQDSPRSIFTSYWSRSSPIGLDRLPLIVSTVAGGNNNNNDNKTNRDEESVNTYERVLLHYEQTAKLEQRGLHRGLENGTSLPLLARATRPIPLSTRNAISATTLETRRRPSCLRPRRGTTTTTSGGIVASGQHQSTTTSTSTSTSVRFSDTVEIVHFAPPAAMWAPNGWSAYFSFDGSTASRRLHC